MFYSLGGENGNEVRARLLNDPTYRVISNDKVFTRRKDLIEEGNYFYAHSHSPAHELKLPKDTFTITCIRDPIKRVLSHYRMLLEYKEKNIAHPCMNDEGQWLGDSFEDFLSNMPRDHLLRQLYMFSKTFDVDEAFDRIVECSHFFFTEDFSRGIEDLSSVLQISLKALHNRKTSKRYTPSKRELDIVLSLLQPEIVLYERLKKYKSCS
jgi:hypothetical protein